jgi:hypothetical protein
MGSDAVSETVWRGCMCIPGTALAARQSRQFQVPTIAVHPAVETLLRVPCLVALPCHDYSIWGS